MIQKKACARKGESIQPLLILHYEPYLAVCAAISSKRGLIHNQFKPKSMKSLYILTFMEGLKEKCHHEVTILLDNASIHRKKAIKEFAKQNKMHLVSNVL